MTPLRQEILDLIKGSPKPLKAYELLRVMSAERGPTAPPTIYRALNFLVERGLVHRIECLHAFSACPDPAHPCEHAFLVCDSCGEAIEIAASDAAGMLRRASARTGFAATLLMQEVRGLCAACQTLAETPEPGAAR